MASSGPSARTLEELREAMERNVLLTLTLHEVKLGLKSNLLRFWFALIMFFGLLFLLSQQGTQSMMSILIFFGFLGSIIHVVIASSTITGEVGGIADSLLSKAVRRWEYLLSKYLSQIILALMVYFLIVGIAGVVIYQMDWYDEDLSWFNVGVLIGMFALILVFFSSVGVMFSSIASKTVFSFLMGLLVWFVMVFLFLIFQNWDVMYSPIRIIDHADLIIEGSWDVDWWKLVAFYVMAPVAFFGVSLVFFYNRDL